MLSNELLKFLWKERISRAHLVPTYDNATKALKCRCHWRQGTQARSLIRPLLNAPDGDVERCQQLPPK